MLGITEILAIENASLSKFISSDSAKTVSAKDYFKQMHVGPKIYFSLLDQEVWFEEAGIRMPKHTSEQNFECVLSWIKSV